jgi:hypothetical protein
MTLFDISWELTFSLKRMHILCASLEFLISLSSTLLRIGAYHIIYLDGVVALPWETLTRKSQLYRKCVHKRVYPETNFVFLLHKQFSPWTIIIINRVICFGIVIVFYVFNQILFVKDGNTFILVEREVEEIC